MNLKSASREYRLHRTVTFKAKGAFWRPQTYRERFVDFYAIKNKLDQGRDTFLMHIRPICNEMLQALLEEAAALGEKRDVSGLVAIKPKKVGKLAGKIRGELSSISAYGKRTIKEERERALQGIDEQAKRREGESDYAVAPKSATGPSATVDPVEYDDLIDEDELAEFLSGKADATAWLIANGLNDFVTQQTITQTKAGLDSAALIALLTPLALAELDRLMRKSANNTVNEAYNMGRGLGVAETLREDAESVRAGIYSALLDEDVCEVCEPLDGMAFFPNEPEFYKYMDGNPECIGTKHGNACRCMMFLEYADMIPPMPGM